MIGESNPKDVVRRGYDALSDRYRTDDGDAEVYAGWIARLLSTVPVAARLLDVGCGCGVPVARDLAAAGVRVTGVDFSDVQITRARRLVPDATFLRADVTDAYFDPGSFDAVVCLYVLIHLPLDEQSPLLAKIASWLRPGGHLLITTGYRAWTGTEENWLGGGAAMWWSHVDADTYRNWLGVAGFTVESEEFVPDGDGGHALFWCRRALAHIARDA